jgi:two-component system chemotaxis response regulator CheY
MKRKVIVVDDSLTVRQQVGKVLIEAGYQVIDAEDGVDGIDKIRAHTDAALVLCDVNMPHMNGLDMVETVLRMDAHRNLPIIMLTTEGQADSLARAKRAGARAWIVKPFRTDMLLATIRKITGPA